MDRTDFENTIRSIKKQVKILRRNGYFICIEKLDKLIYKVCANRDKIWILTPQESKEVIESCINYLEGELRHIHI